MAGEGDLLEEVGGAYTQTACGFNRKGGEGGVLCDTDFFVLVVRAAAHSAVPACVLWALSRWESAREWEMTRR